MSEENEASEELTPEEALHELDLGIELSDEERAAAEEMVQHLQAQFGVDEEVQEDSPPDIFPEQEEPPSESEGEGERAGGDEELSPPPPPPAAPTSVTVDGVELPLDEIRSLRQLRDYITAHPEAAQKLYTPEEPSAPPEPQIPEWLDTDDPAQMAMWRQINEQNRQINELTAAQQQDRQESANRTAANETEAAVNIFRNNHPELSEDDIWTLRRHATASGIAEGVIKAHGVAAGVPKALDLAYLDHPEFRARAAGEPTPAEKRAATAKERKDKLSALGGSSGSTPRTNPAPDLSSDNAAKKAAADFLRQSDPNFR
jgi:hypothetical protein